MYLVYKILNNLLFYSENKRISKFWQFHPKINFSCHRHIWHQKMQKFMEKFIYDMKLLKSDYILMKIWQNWKIHQFYTVKQCFLLQNLVYWVHLAGDLQLGFQASPDITWHGKKFKKYLKVCWFTKHISHCSARGKKDIGSWR